MKLIESALFRLVLHGKISLGQAKILKAIHENRACSLYALRFETGLGLQELSYAIACLREIGMLIEMHGFYFCPGFDEQICALMGDEKLVAEKSVMFARV